MEFVYKDQENITSNVLKTRGNGNTQKAEGQVLKRSVLGVINVDSNKIGASKYKQNVSILCIAT